MSWTGGGVLIPCEDSASAVYRKLFLQGSKVEVERQINKLKLGQSIMDSLAEQARALSRRLGTGDRDLAAARQAGLLGMAMGIAILSLLVVVPLGFPERIVRVFLEPGDPGFARVAALSVQLLVIAAIFQVFDGLQAIASRALRGIRDTVAPLWLAAFGYWALGIGGGCLLAFPLGMGAVGLWWGMAMGLIVTGSLLAWRFVRLTARPLPVHPR